MADRERMGGGSQGDAGCAGQLDAHRGGLVGRQAFYEGAAEPGGRGGGCRRRGGFGLTGHDRVGLRNVLQPHQATLDTIGLGAMHIGEHHHDAAFGFALGGIGGRRQALDLRLDRGNPFQIDGGFGRRLVRAGRCGLVRQRVVG